MDTGSKPLTMTIETVGYSSHGVKFGGSKGILHTDMEWSKCLVVGIQVSVKDFRMQLYEGELHFYATKNESALIFLHPSEKRGPIQTIETFAGLAGWTQVMEHFGDKPSILVEADPETARVCAKQLGAPCIRAREYVEKVITGEDMPCCVLVEKVEEPMVWVAAGVANVGKMVGSPPCQPWSGAGCNKGLSSDDGRAFQSCLEWAAFMQFMVVVLENVAGLPKHDDFKPMIQDIAAKGLVLQLHGVFSCHQLLPVKRDRWLGTFVHRSCEVDANPVRMANYMNFTGCMFSCIATLPKVGFFDVEHKNYGKHERELLEIPPGALEMLGNHDLAPWWLKSKIANGSHENVIDGRVVKMDQQCPCFMASYGKQHELDMQLLKAKGLQTVLLADKDGKRMWSPWEMLAALAYKPETVLSADLHTAWKQAGNGLSAAHAWLAIQKTVVMLGVASPWNGQTDPIKHVQEVLAARIHMSKYETCKDGEFWMLSECNKEPSTKKAKRDQEVEPTVPFTVEEADPVATKAFERCPLFVQTDDPRWNAAVACLGSSKMVLLEHMEKHWVMFVNATADDSVANAIQKGLPHAKPEHFQSLRMEDRDVQWVQKLPDKACQTIVFEPVYKDVVCSEKSLNLQIKVQSDVTWSVRTTIAYVACEIGCNPDAVVLLHKNIMMPDTAFLAEYDTVDFDMKFKACLPAYVSWEPKGKQVKDLGFVPSAKDVRWCARHPNRKVVRTCAADGSMTVGAMMKALFPDLHANTPWSVFSKGRECTADAHVNGFDDIQIQWNGARPLPVTDVNKVRWSQEIDTPSVQARINEDYKILIVRSPFRIRPQDLKCPMQVTIAEMAASYLNMSRVMSSMVVSQNGQVVDPMLKAGEVNEDWVLDIRVCPMLGGGKQEKIEAVKNKLKVMLAERGVPSDKMEERVTGLMSKVQQDKLQNLGDPQAPGTWNELKELASAAQFRLITPAELKLLQQANRKNKPAGKNEEKEAKVKKIKTFSPEAHAIRVDPAHFQAEGHQVQMLEVGRFGPDQSGLCIVTPDEARRCMQMGARSADPLALLVIGEGVQSIGNTFSLPAHLSNGSPVIVKACLLQFGDVQIDFQLQLPMAEVTQMESTVIEFGIHKKFVGNWQDTAVPLHYVGVHVPALRGNNLLAVWSVKAWSNSKVVHHNQADHWHGYFRIADSLLQQVLSRSGSVGIFMNPKTADRKHDPRFTMVNLPNKQLQEVALKADTCQKALGIVKIGDGFAIRCKREDAASVRAQLLPDSAYVETATFTSDQVLFVAKNVPQVGREELTEALQKTGWDATAVRPQGMNRWILAAKGEPNSSHVVINGAIMMVERLQRPTDSVPITMVAREVRVNTTNENGIVSTTFRFAEFRAQVEAQISQAVETKLQVANSKIEQLSQALHDVQTKTESAHTSLANDLGHVREEQAFTQKKLAEVETSVAASSHQIIAQMQSMFSKMQANMEQTVQSLVNDPEKRQRTEPAKADPFAPKA